MGKLLSGEAIAAYHRNGYHFPERALSEEEAAACRAELERHEAAAGGTLEGRYRTKPHLLYTFLADLIRHPRILDAVEDIIGPNILAWNANFFTKEARNADFVSWHQDATYWGLSSAEVVTAWIAFTPSDHASGAMAVMPGTHTQQFEHKDTFAEHNLLSRGQEVQVEVDPAQAVELTLRPGEFSLHHVLLVHGSGPNTSDDRRIGYAVRYIPTHLRQVAGEQDSATLVRGEDAYGHFELEPRPPADLDPDMVALHARVTDRSARILYRGTDVMDSDPSKVASLNKRRL